MDTTISQEEQDIGLDVPIDVHANVYTFIFVFLNSKEVTKYNVIFH